MASPTTEARNARAQALGYRNYYDYRIHDNGRIPPEESSLQGSDLTRARGHRGYMDLRAALGEGDLVSVSDVGPRNRLGQYQWVDVSVADANGDETVYTIRGSRISDLIDDIEDLEYEGVTFSPAYGLTTGE